VRAGRHECGDAGDRAYLRCALSLEDRVGTAGEDRQSRKEDAEEFHEPRRLRHYCRGAALSCAADPRRSAAAVRQRWPAALCAAEERGGGEQAGGVPALSPCACVTSFTVLSAA